MKRFAIIKKNMAADAVRLLGRNPDARLVNGELLYQVSLHELISLYEANAVLQESKE